LNAFGSLWQAWSKIVGWLTLDVARATGGEITWLPAEWF